jgi:hypothetical protein
MVRGENMILNVAHRRSLRRGGEPPSNRKPRTYLERIDARSIRVEVHEMHLDVVLRSVESVANEDVMSFSTVSHAYQVYYAS